MPIIHIVLFEFSKDASAETITDVCDRMLALKTQCVHPQTGQAYLQFGIGGKDNSPEGLQGGFTHGFVVELASEADRQYYLTADPAHLAFVKSLDGIVANVRVVDFEPGVY